MVEKYFQDCTIELMDSTHRCTKGLESVRSVFKQMLNQLHTPYYDDLDVPRNVVPLRYNITTEAIERYDPETKTWIEIVVVGGSSLLTYRTTAVSGDFLITDRVLEVTVAATITMNFVPVVGIKYDIKNSGVGVVTVDGGAYNIDGAATHPIPSGESRTFFFNGTQFIII